MVIAEDGQRYTMDLYRPTLESVQVLIERMKESDLLFEDHPQGGPLNMLKGLLDRNTVILEIDDAGIIYFTHIHPGHNAAAHFFFWNKRMALRHRVLYKAVDWIMEQFDLHRIDIYVPSFAYAVLRRLQQMGVRLEGVQRQSLRTEKGWRDLYCFGILREELTEESYNEGKLKRTEEESKWFGLLRDQPRLMKRILRGREAHVGTS